MIIQQIQQIPLIAPNRGPMIIQQIKIKTRDPNPNKSNKNPSRLLWKSNKPLFSLLYFNQTNASKVWDVKQIETRCCEWRCRGLRTDGTDWSEGEMACNYKQLIADCWYKSIFNPGIVCYYILALHPRFQFQPCVSTCGHILVFFNCQSIGSYIFWLMVILQGT